MEETSLLSEAETALPRAGLPGPGRHLPAGRSGLHTRHADGHVREQDGLQRGRAVRLHQPGRSFQAGAVSQPARSAPLCPRPAEDDVPRPHPGDGAPAAGAGRGAVWRARAAQAGRGGPETPWHQDEAFRSPDFVYSELSIWLALQPATLENGCMQFIPGSNKWDVLEHRSPGGDKHLHPLECCGDFARDLAVAEPLAPGGCTARRAHTASHRRQHLRRAQAGLHPDLQHAARVQAGTPRVPVAGRPLDRQPDAQEGMASPRRPGGGPGAAPAGHPPDQSALAGLGHHPRGQQGLAALTRSGAPPGPGAGQLDARPPEASYVRRPHARRLAESVKAAPAGPRPPAPARILAAPGRRALLHCKAALPPAAPFFQENQGRHAIGPFPMFRLCPRHAARRARMRRFRRASRTLQTQP